MAYTLVTVPIIDPDFRTEENWSRMEMDSYINSDLIGELAAEFDIAAFSTDHGVRTKLNIQARLPSGQKVEGVTNHSMRKGLIAFLDASEAKKFVMAYLEKSSGICIPEVTQIYADFNPADWNHE